MDKLYFSASESLSEERKAFLNENRQILSSVLEAVALKERKEGRKMPDSYRILKAGVIKRIKNRKTANSLSIKETKQMINFLQELLGINKEISLSNNLLINYMYELSRQCYDTEYGREAYLELFNKKVRHDTQDDEVSNKSPKKLISAGVRYSRNRMLSIEVTKRANYLCEFNAKHLHFISSTTQKNYVEAHHLIPLAFQKYFHNSLDVIENMVSLCVVCHKKIHHASNLKEKEEILSKLYDERVEGLKKRGIFIDYKNFLSYYKNDLLEDD
ncbi:HNH endonuclease [Priestia sp. SIMBA_032]|uniref:HNH endonuclease n=1 Tax=Priestia sp. SIMBA_032 TaxID=3085775 RepID=UPI00397E0978